MAPTEFKRRADLSDLNERQRRAARLVCVAGMTAHAAARELGISPSAVKFAVAKLQRPLGSVAENL